MFSSLNEDDLNIDDVLGVVFVAFVDFDIYDGTSLTACYPKEDKLEVNIPTKFIVNCSLPDGAHLHQTDQSYMVLRDKDIFYYGIAFFRNKFDSTVARGAIQRALIVVSTLPHYHSFEQPCYEVLEESLTADVETLKKYSKQLYKSFKINPKHVITTTGLDSTAHHITVKPFNHTFKLKVPAYYFPSQFNGSSVLHLYKTLKNDIMIVWFYLLHRKRILFVGEKAQSVGACCISCCSIILPLIVFQKDLVPYITLPDIDYLLSKSSYIAGSTNKLLYQRSEWFDLAIDITTGELIQSSKVKYKLTKSDKIFTETINSKIDKCYSDSWISEEFRNYTLHFIYQFKENKLPRSIRKHFEHFDKSVLYQNFLKNSEYIEELDNYIKKQDLIPSRRQTLSSSQSIKRRLPFKKDKSKSEQPTTIRRGSETIRPARSISSYSLKRILTRPEKDQKLDQKRHSTISKQNKPRKSLITHENSVNDEYDTRSDIEFINNNKPKPINALSCIELDVPKDSSDTTDVDDFSFYDGDLEDSEDMYIFSDSFSTRKSRRRNTPNLKLSQGKTELKNEGKTLLFIEEDEQETTLDQKMKGDLHPKTLRIKERKWFVFSISQIIIFLFLFFVILLISNIIYSSNYII